MKTSRFFAGASLFAIALCSSGQAPILAPPKQITDLAWSIGTWSGSMHWTMAGMPKSDSVTTLQIDMDGQFLRERSSEEVMGTAITETAYMGWNGKENRYDCWGFSNLAPSPRIEHGTVTGKTWVFESEPWLAMGQMSTARSTVSMVSDTEMKMTVEFKVGDSWTKVAEGTLKKTAAAAE